MDKEKVLASEGGKPSTSGGDKRLVSDQPSSGQTATPSLPQEEKPGGISPPLPEKPKGTAATVTENPLKDRIRKSTIEGGIKKVPDNFTEDNGDWKVIKSENPFEALYLDHEQYESITDEMVKNNYEVIKKFWDEKIRQAGGSLIISERYGGNKAMGQYLIRLEEANKRLSSKEGRRQCFSEIDKKRLEIGRQHIQPTIEAVLSDGIYTPDEKDTVLKYGWKENLRDDEIVEHLIKELEANGFYPYEKIKDGAAVTEKVSVVWVRKDKAEDYEKLQGKGKKETLAQQDSLTMLERDFVAATKRDKALNTNTANFLYDKGADLGLDNSKVTDLIKKLGEKYRVDIKAGIPKLEIDKTSFELSNMEFHSTASRSFTISNTGAGTLSGTIKTLTKANKAWLKVEQKSIDTQNKQEISFKVDTSALDYGDKDTGKIEIQSNSGATTIEVKISIQEATEYIRRFRSGITWGGLIFGALFGFLLYTINFVPGMNTNVLDIAAIPAFICLVILVVRVHVVWIVGGIVLVILWAYFPHASSTLAWALIYGSFAYLSARSIWYARRRGEWKIPIAIGVEALVLTAGIIIGEGKIGSKIGKNRVSDHLSKSFDFRTAAI